MCVYLWVYVCVCVAPQDWRVFISSMPFSFSPILSFLKSTKERAITNGFIQLNIEKQAVSALKSILEQLAAMEKGKETSQERDIGQGNRSVSPG